MSNSLEGDAYAINVADLRMDGRMTDLWYEINILFFSLEKVGYNQLMLYEKAMKMPPG